MSSKKYATPLLLRRKPSYVGTLIYVGIASSTLTFIYFLPVPFTAKALLFAIVSVSVGYTLLREWGYASQRAIQHLTWLDGNAWILEAVNRQKLDAILLADSLNLPYLVILNFRLPGRFWPMSIVLFPDSCTGESLRQLRVRLRMHNASTVSIIF